MGYTQSLDGDTRSSAAPIAHQYVDPANFD
jgi:hypothetical protein